MNDQFVIPSRLRPSKKTLAIIGKFFAAFLPDEITQSAKLVLQFDEKSHAYYIICHLVAADLVKSCDLEASLDANDEDEIYKLNREITEDESAYRTMEEDAVFGRTFEDMVMEFDTSYRSNKPLKVYGGQHRIKAIINAHHVKGLTLHGVRIYFDLSKEQKVEIATINNTSIAVPNDLLDRMREQLLGSQLREWCQNVGLLGRGKDFADRKSPDLPTVRVARTLVVNFDRGLKAKEDDFHRPILCKSGGVDEDYLAIRNTIDWSDQRLIQMGTEFAQLHKLQRERVTARDKDTSAEFARKALSLTVVASWAYAAGLFQRNPELLRCHYGIPDLVIAPEDPLNAKALSQARLKGVDPDTYRGLGTRTSPNEMGRMLEVFLVLASKAAKKKITKDLANAAIQSFEAKRATFEANKVLGKI